MSTEFRLPDIGEGIHEGEIVQWLVKPGDTVQEDQPLLEVMTDKVTAEIPSPYSGVVTELRGKQGEVVKVGSVIVMFDRTGGGPVTPAAAEKTAQAEAPATTRNGKHTAQAASTVVLDRPSGLPSGEKVLAAPATRKLARQLGVDLTMIAGSGPRGRVTPDDVRSYSPGGVSAPTPRTSPAAQSFTSGEDRRVPFAGMRRRIAEHLVKSKQTVPHFAYVDEVDMTALVRLRSDLKDEAEAQGVKLSYLPFVIKAVTAGLRKYPVLNSQLDEERQELVYKGGVNMGVAVATNEGLIVPVIQHADQKSILTLGREIKELADKARSGKLALDDLRGGTFTITSIGSIGGMFGVPIINHPEVAILGVNKIARRPVVRTVNGQEQIIIADVMYLSISGDHRVVDGAETAEFMNYVISILQNPTRLLLEGV